MYLHFAGLGHFRKIQYYYKTSDSLGTNNKYGILTYARFVRSFDSLSWQPPTAAKGETLNIYIYIYNTDNDISGSDVLMSLVINYVRRNREYNTLIVE